MHNFLFADSTSSAKMIHGNKDADGRTGPSHIASMKPLKNPHDVMLPRRTKSMAETGSKTRFLAFP